MVGLKGRQSSYVLPPNFEALGAELLERGLHVERVLQNNGIGHQPEGGELLFLPFAVAFADLAAVAVADPARDGMTTLTPVDLDQNAPFRLVNESLICP